MPPLNAATACVFRTVQSVSPIGPGVPASRNCEVPPGAAAQYSAARRIRIKPPV